MNPFFGFGGFGFPQSPFMGGYMPSPNFGAGSLYGGFPMFNQQPIGGNPNFGMPNFAAFRSMAGSGAPSSGISQEQLQQRRANLAASQQPTAQNSPMQQSPFGLPPPSVYTTSFPNVPSGVGVASGSQYGLSGRFNPFQMQQSFYGFNPMMQRGMVNQPPQNFGLLNPQNQTPGGISSIKDRSSLSFLTPMLGGA